MKKLLVLTLIFIFLAGCEKKRENLSLSLAEQKEIIDQLIGEWKSDNTILIFSLDPRVSKMETDPITDTDFYIYRDKSYKISKSPLGESYCRLNILGLWGPTEYFDFYFSKNIWGIPILTTIEKDNIINYEKEVTIPVIRLEVCKELCENVTPCQRPASPNEEHYVLPNICPYCGENLLQKVQSSSSYLDCVKGITDLTNFYITGNGGNDVLEMYIVYISPIILS